MLLPKYLLKASGPSRDQNVSESVAYDYSGADEIQKRQDEASQQAAARYKALYDGDVAGSVAAGQRIRDLLSSLASIQPVRIARLERGGGVDASAGAFEGKHDEPQPMTKIDGNYSTAGVRGKKPPNKQRPATRSESMSRVLAGEPKVDPGLV